MAMPMHCQDDHVNLQGYCDRVESKDKAYQTNFEDLRPCCHQQSQDSDNIANRVAGANNFQKV